jgi:hypothetical protein
MKTRIFITASLIILSCLSAMAQKPTPFASKTTNPDKIKAMLDFPTEGRNTENGSGYSANVDLLNPKPKKVALISFYLYDPACGKSTGGTYTGTATASCWRTDETTAQGHVDGFYGQSIEVLKSEFKQYGMELLTPEEFITTDEKAEFYYGFNQESAKKEKSDVTVRKAAGTSISSVAEASVSTLKISPTGKGYRAFFVANEKMSESIILNFKNTGVMGANRKMSSSLGYELCKGLDVDAVVVCYIVTRKIKMNKNDYAVNAVNLYMFGPNPKSEGDEDKNRGQFYCGTRFFSKPLLFQTNKGGAASYDNMGNVMKALAAKLCNWVINKEK